MSLKSFSLLPQQKQFYTYLSDLASKADLCAGFLKSYIEGPNASARKKVGQDIARCRAQSKATMGELTEELCRSFVTPFDREDIQNFAHCLYRIPKIVEKAVQRMELHGLEEEGSRTDFSRQIDVIADEAEAMEKMVDALLHRRNAKQVIKNVSLLHDLEQHGDDVLQDLLASLFSDKRSARDLLLRKDIYNFLEKAIDCYRDAASVALQIVLKYN